MKHLTRSITKTNSLQQTHFLALIGACALLTATPAMALALAPSTDGVARAVNTTQTAGKSTARRLADELSHAFRDAAKTLAPSVVTINTTSTKLDDRGRAQHGTGTGVVISRDGYIVTANHVVADADEIELVLHDGRTAKATVVGLDPGTDIAVLRTEESGLIPAGFADSDALEPGEWVVAIGAPFGLERTVTAGIVSAKGRSDVGLATFENYIQTDAAINPGNSGGPLANLDGAVIGINSAISSRGGGNDGIGFAVPSSVVRRVADSIIATGRVARGYLGIGVQPADAEMLAGLGIAKDAGVGVLVNRVESDSPAAKAGIEPGDLITSIAGRSVHTPGELVATISEIAPGSEVDLRAIRNSDERRMRATLAERPDASAPQAERNSAAKPSSASVKLGMVLREISADELAALGAAANMGAETGAVLVESVNANSPAADAGIAPGDLIRRLGAHTVHTLKQAQSALKEIAADAAVPALVERQGQSRFVLIRAAPTSSDTRR
jgi:serine protease Do